MARTIGELCKQARISGECTEYELKRNGKLEYCVKCYPKCERLEALMKKYWKDGEEDENA